MTTKNENERTRLIDFLLGVLPPREASALEAELEQDAGLRDRLAALAGDFDGVRAALDLPSTDDAGRSALLAAAGGGFESFEPRLGAFLDLPPEQTRAILELAATAPEQWADAPAPGVWTQPIDAGPRHREAGAFLLSVAPGAEIPRHRHRGAEWGFVLGGQLADDGGDFKSAGDIVHNSPGSVHRVWNPGICPAIAVNVVYDGYDWQP